MQRRSSYLSGPLALFLLCLGCGTPSVEPSPAAAQPEASSPAFFLLDVYGNRHQPFASPDVKAAVLTFVLADCPIANGYAPELQRLAQEYEPRGVRFYLVQVDPDVTNQEARQHAREFGYTCPVVVDSQHVLVRRAGATHVPEAAVFTPDGERRYLGRIDDQYAALGKRRAQPTSRDLRDALDAVLEKRPVAHPVTQSVGCSIPPLTLKDAPP